VAAYRGVMGVLRVSAFVLLLLALAATAVLESRSLGAAEPGSGVVVAGAGAVSMDQAVKMAEQRFKARVVRAEAQRDGVRTIYVLKLLNEAGHVWTVRVDAANGVIL
jgi:uncharacterized membrane protein YkoI